MDLQPRRISKQIPVSSLPHNPRERLIPQTVYSNKVNTDISFDHRPSRVSITHISGTESQESAATPTPEIPHRTLSINMHRPKTTPFKSGSKRHHEPDSRRDTLLNRGNSEYKRNTGLELEA